MISVLLQIMCAFVDVGWSMLNLAAKRNAQMVAGVDAIRDRNIAVNEQDPLQQPNMSIFEQVGMGVGVGVGLCMNGSIHEHASAEPFALHCWYLLQHTHTITTRV